MDQKEVYDGDLVQSLTQTQENLRTSTGKVHALEKSHASLQASYRLALAENEELKNEIATWERDYELLEDKNGVEVSWVFLNSRHDALVAVSQENFNLESELAKIMETIEKAQQPLDFPSLAIEVPKVEAPEVEVPVSETQVPDSEVPVNVNTGTCIMILSSPIEPTPASQIETASIDVPAQIGTVASDDPVSLPQSSQ